MSIKEKLESLGRNSIQLKIARKETYKLGATRFGGKPDVPPDFVWPTYEGESYDHVVKDRPLTFLAQFNCEELAQFDKEHLLPDHGLLSFFYETDTQCWGYDPKNQGCARVYWFEDMSALSAADFPADMGEDFKFPMVKIKLDAKTSYSRDARRVYYLNREIKGADRDSFAVCTPLDAPPLADHLARDKDHFYQNDEIMEETQWLEQLRKMTQEP